ncbi:MAG: DUF945 family protein [Verrucomicrobiales bacterium]|nr:DUF945 family protein [Verrucomicrobiales bacterium]
MNPVSINRDGQAFGPYALGDLPPMIASGQLVASDLAWHDALPDWQPLGTLPELAHLFQPAAPQPQSSATARYLAQHEKTREKKSRPKPDPKQPKPRSRSTGKTVALVLLTVLVLALLVGYAIVTSLFGSAVKMVINDNATSAENFNPDFEYEIVSYNRGFLHSTAELTIVPPLPTLGPPSPGVPVVLDIYHGPLLTGPGGTRPGAHRIIARVDTTKFPAADTITFAGDEMTQLVFEAGLSGDVHIDGFITGFTTTPQKDDSAPAPIPGSMTFSGAKGSFDATGDFSALSAEFECGEWTVDDPGNGSKLHSAPVTLNIDLPEIADGQIVNGTVTFTAPELTLSSPDLQMRMTNLKLESVTTTRSTTYRSDLSFKLDNLTVSGEAVPLLIDGSANFNFGVRGVDVTSLANMRAATLALQNAAPEIDTGSDTTQTGPLRDYTNAVADMLQPGLGISAGAVVSSVGGAASLSFDIGFEGDRTGREIETLGQAIGSLECNARASLSKSFINDESFEEMVAGLCEDGTVADLKNKYSITFTMSGGNSRLNGQPMELPAFIQESIDEPIPWDFFSQSPGYDPSSDEPPTLVSPSELDAPMPAGDPSDPNLPPMATDTENLAPDDPGIPYDPTAPDEENMRRNNP